jgi:GH25 family lysozyme M1 (1,4-beta-N-acetylmuramidase)
VTLAGIDISQWQTVTPDLSDVDFVFVRATYGTGRDTRYAMHAAHICKAGLVLGAFAFGRNGDGVAQAQAFLAVAHGADLLALDLEGDGANPPMTQAQAKAFIAAVHKAGYRIGLYHSLSGYPDLGQDWRWVAYWGPTPPKIKWDIWQYRGAPLDLDRFGGTRAELLALGAPQAPKAEAIS